MIEAPPGWQFCGPYIVPVPPRVLISEIQARVVTHFGLPAGAMVSPRRDRLFAHPRQVAMYLSKTLASKSTIEIGRRFGGRDHTTVMHAIRAVEARRMEDPILDKAIRSITASLKGMSHLIREAA